MSRSACPLARRLRVRRRGRWALHADTQYLGIASNFQDNYDAVRQACADLIGTAGITAADYDPWPCSFDCGNGIVGGGEECDDGNLSNGDCCSFTCQYESPGSVCAGTGTSLCAAPAGQCDGAGTCVGVIRTGCRSALKAILLVGNPSGEKDRLIWKWLNGDATMLADFGSPTTTTEDALCVYVGTSAVAIVEADVAPGGGLWGAAGTTSLKYKDPAGSSDGVTRVLLKEGAAGKAKALLKGKGANLPDPPAGPYTLPVTAQLVNSANSVCFEGVYDTADIIKNEADQFKAKAQ